MSYQTKAAQKLEEVYQRYRGAAGGMAGMILATLGPSIPSVLRNIDESPELRAQIGGIVKDLADAFAEDEADTGQVHDLGVSETLQVSDEINAKGEDDG